MTLITQPLRRRKTAQEEEMSVPSRRAVLGMLAAAGAAVPAAGCQTMNRGGFFERNDLPVGIQLYTLGELLRTDLDGTVGEIARIGYKTVEIPNYMGRTPEQLRALFDRNGLACTSAHVGLGAGSDAQPGLLGDLSLLARHMETLGARYVVAPILAIPPDLASAAAAQGPGVRTIAWATANMTADHWKRLAEQLNTIGRTLKASGLTFGYHNHNIEFVAVGEGTGWDLLLAETDPELVVFELDVGWTAAAGVDPAALLARDPGRYRLLHVKDVKPSTVANFELRMDPTEVGSGRVDWASVLPAAYAAGVREFFVEQEAPFERSRLEAAAISHGFLNTLRA
jgi:sugar phosphate isomerase/epimerase